MAHALTGFWERGIGRELTRAGCPLLAIALIGPVLGRAQALAQDRPRAAATVADYNLLQAGSAQIIASRLSWNNGPVRFERSRKQAIGPTTVAGRSVWQYDEVFGLGTPRERRLRYFQEVTANYSRTVGYQTTQWTPQVLEEPWLDLVGPIAVGTKWKFRSANMTVSAGNVQVLSEIVATGVAIEMWRHCIHIRSTERSLGAAEVNCDGQPRHFSIMTATRNIWFCPNVGEVRSKSETRYKLDGGRFCTRVSDFWLERMEPPTVGAPSGK